MSLYDVDIVERLRKNDAKAQFSTNQSPPYSIQGEAADEIEKLRHDISRAMANHNADLNTSAPEGDARDAALWRDLVLLDQMDVVVIFGGAQSNEELLAKLREWIERKRSEPQSLPVAHSKSEYKRIKAQGGDVLPPAASSEAKEGK